MIALLSISFMLFLLMDSIGSIPCYISLLKGIESHKQLRIIIREMIIALTIILLFYFSGEGILQFLDIRSETINIAGGVILFLISIKMIFPPDIEERDKGLKQITEPFVVPLAIPLIAGPALLATVILYARKDISMLIMTGAILIAWLASLIILIISPWLSKKLGEKGIIAIERLMGLLLVLISIQMLLNGLSSFFFQTPSP
jgi:multiple antibiotic resistance protein